MVTAKIVEGRFQGKVVVVTGAAGGIGAATARRFAAEGAALVLTDLSEVTSWSDWSKKVTKSLHFVITIPWEASVG